MSSCRVMTSEASSGPGARLHRHGPMNDPDRRARRNYALLVCAMIAVAAYFQARGVASLIAAKVTAAPAPAGESAETASEPEDPHAQGKRIIEHNVFDSQGRPAASVSPSAAPSSSSSSDAVPCPDARVVLISVSDDAAWSFAAIEEGGKTALRRVGDAVAGGKLARLAWDRVWLKKGDGECELVLKGVSRTPEPERPAEAVAGGDDISAKIERVSDNEVKIAHGAGDDLANRLSAELLHQIQLDPVKRGDHTTGVRPRGIKKGSVAYMLGVRDGDELQSLGGIPLTLTSPEQAFDVFARVRDMNRAQLSLVRDGRPMTIDFTMK